VLFSDFREVADDIALPYKTEVYSDSDLISAVVITAVEINRGLADDLFDPDRVAMKRGGTRSVPGETRRASDTLQ